MGKSGMTADRSLDADHRDPALVSLHSVARLFSILLMIAGGLFAKRMLGMAAGLGVLALLACDPMLIHFSQHALIDGFFAFWAAMCMWTTWECLRNPRSPGWLAAHCACLALMVLTKENAFFVYCALCATAVANRWLHFGTVTPRFVLAGIAGPLLGVATLVLLAGGIAPFVEVYQTVITKAQSLNYARLTGDGPWYRYLLDLMTISPIILCLALGALFALVPHRKEAAFLAVFVVASYLIMCNVRHGMNLRYASIWELPLRATAFCMVWQLCGRLGHRQWLAATIVVAALCAYDLRQYVILATNPALPLYEMVPADLLRLVKIIKLS
jgi:4-amino-4-deoxy-L-arabinose transferase-like glycosyltransferase